MSPEDRDPVADPEAHTAASGDAYAADLAGRAAGSGRSSIGFGLLALLLVLGLDGLLDRYLPAGPSFASRPPAEAPANREGTAAEPGAGNGERGAEHETPRQRSDRLLAQLRAAAARTEPKRHRLQQEEERQAAEAAARQTRARERRERERRARHRQELWDRHYRREMAGVFALERSLRQRIGREPFAQLAGSCGELLARLQAVEPRTFWPADEALGLQVRRMASLLARATTSCRRGHFFAFQRDLEEARRARYWLEHRLGRSRDEMR